jgi:hypothetical protein
MKKVPFVIAWMGVATLLAASLPTFNISCEYVVHPQTAGRVTEGAILSVVLGIFGVLLSGIGGFFTKSRVVALGIISSGAIYIIAFIPWIIRVPSGYEWLSALPPGVVAVICGCALLTTRHRIWWFLGSFGVPVLLLIVVVLGVFGVFQPAPVYEPIELPPSETVSGEITLALDSDGGYYSIITSETDGFSREYLRLWHQGPYSTCIDVMSPRAGMLLPLVGDVDVPIDQISLPVVGYQAKVYSDVGPQGPWRYDPPGRYGRIIAYSETARWSYNITPACVSYTKHDNIEQYVIFRLKEYVLGERVVIEYRYAQPTTP